MSSRKLLVSAFSIAAVFAFGASQAQAATEIQFWHAMSFTRSASA